MQEQALPAGTLIDSFEIRRVLGTGGFGITYEAYDRSLQCVVAIKEYFPSGLVSRDSDSTIHPRSSDQTSAFDYGLERFLSEARILAKFQDNSIVRVSRFLEANNTAYLVMEFEDGKALSDVIVRMGRLNEKQAKAVAVHILRGLQAIHAKNFLHRDIKPSNVVIRKKGPPVLLDFGAARMALEHQIGAMTVVLTPGYAPIEQYSADAQQGPYSDLYALGGTLYHCVTGHPPSAATQRLGMLHDGKPRPS